MALGGEETLTKHMWPPPMVTRRAGLRGVMSNWRGALPHLLHDEAAVHADGDAVDAAAGGGEDVAGLGVEEVDAGLLEHAHGGVVDGGDALGRQRLGGAVGVERDAPGHLGDGVGGAVPGVAGVAAAAASPALRHGCPSSRSRNHA